MPDRPISIVVVDDTEATRYAVCRILRKAGYEVREANTAADSLRLAAEYKPDLMILDINLPDMSGYELCGRIKANPGTAAVLVLHISASFVESEDRSQGLERGADGYLTYPVEPRELLAHVEALLRIQRAERAVRSQRELLQVTLSSIGDGVVATDAAEIVTFINPAAQTLTGWTAAEAVSQPLSNIFHIVNEDTGEPGVNPVDKVIRTGRIAGLANHTLLISRDGSRRPIDDTAAPIRDEQGNFVGVVLVFRDVSERRRLEKELMDRDRAKDEFLALLGHELRNPLAPLRNCLEVLRARFSGEPKFDQISGVMDRQLRHMVRLVDDLLDVSRIARGKIELRNESVELASVIARTVEGVRSFLEERQHRLELTLPPDPLWLWADPARLEQILANLLTNAGKYTGAGGHIRLSAMRENDQIVVRVTDNGIGIRPEILDRLWDMFRQGDRVAGHVSEGLGVGLTLVKRLVELHRGTVEAYSDGPGQGSEFTVRLPLMTRDNSRPAAPSATSPRRGTESARVLITDDNADAAESLAMLLRLAGHEVRTASDGMQALELARSFRPEIVLLDVGLPRGMDGYEVARRLRQASGLEQVVIVATTGYGTEKDVAKARAAGMNHHLTKPVDSNQLLRIIGDVTRVAATGEKEPDSKTYQQTEESP